MEKEQGVQGVSTRGESGLEEDWNMEVDEEVDNKKLQRKRLQKQPQEIENFSDMDQMFRDGQKEKWKEEPQEIDKKRNKLLPEHQKMQRRSQKMQSLQHKKRDVLKDACSCDDEMRKVRNEINEREARFLELAEESGSR